jgi:hypothetical protein
MSIAGDFWTGLHFSSTGVFSSKLAPWSFPPPPPPHHQTRFSCFYAPRDLQVLHIQKSSVSVTSVLATLTEIIFRIRHCSLHSQRTVFSLLTEAVSIAVSFGTCSIQIPARTPTSLRSSCFFCASSGKCRDLAELFVLSGRYCQVIVIGFIGHFKDTTRDNTLQITITRED